jgi:hypothetical protein
MKGFKDLEFHESEDYDDGVYAFEFFDNNFGVSVIKNRYSHGGSKGLYELAVVYMSPEMTESEIHYNNDVAQGDVRGYLTEDDVTELMEQVQNF